MLPCLFGMFRLFLVRMAERTQLISTIPVGFAAAKKGQGPRLIST